MGSKLNVAFIGLGPHAEENLLPALCMSEYFRLKVLCSRDATKARDWADRFNVPEIATNWAEVIQQKSVDAVFVSGPPELHEQVLETCFRCGLPVFVEKPPAASLEGLKDLLRLQELTQGRCFVGYNFRFADAYLKLQSNFKNAQLEFQNVSLYSNKPHAPLWGHGSVLKSFLLAVGIHALEAVIHQGGSPVSVDSKVSFLRDGNFHLSVTLKFEAGGSAVINMGNYKKAFDSQFEFYFTNGTSARLSNLRDLSMQGLGVTQDGALSKASVMVSPSGLKGGFALSGYSHELNAFAAEIRGLSHPQSPLAQSLIVYKVIHEILKQNQGTSSELL